MAGDLVFEPHVVCSATVLLEDVTRTYIFQRRQSRDYLYTNHHTSILSYVEHFSVRCINLYLVVIGDYQFGNPSTPDFSPDDFVCQPVAYSFGNESV